MLQAQRVLARLEPQVQRCLASDLPVDADLGTRRRTVNVRQHAAGVRHHRWLRVAEQRFAERQVFSDSNSHSNSNSSASGQRPAGGRGDADGAQRRQSGAHALESVTARPGATNWTTGPLAAGQATVWNTDEAIEGEHRG
jgi:hypothetical protein